MKHPRVALIHYWLVGMRGGEKVLEALCRIYPQADIFTHVHDPAAMSDTIRAHRVTETYVGRLPFAKRMYQSYLPLMPGALEALDLTGYELVISSEAGPAKGVIVPPDAFHLCYVHSPMRYLWDQYNVYRDGAGPLTRAAMPLLAPRLRMWDVTSAARVDHFLANSTHVANRVNKYWPCPSGGHSSRQRHPAGQDRLCDPEIAYGALQGADLPRRRGLRHGPGRGHGLWPSGDRLWARRRA